MAKNRERKIRSVRRAVNGLNIAINPHPDGRYVDMFRKVLSNKTEFAFYGTRTGTITGFRKEQGSEHLYRGVLALFSNVNFDRAWLNKDTGEAAEADVVAKIEIPSGLKPEFQKISFVFDSKRHRMVYFSKGLGVSSARNLIEGLFKTGEVLNEGDELVIKVIQDKDNLDSMLNDSGIKEMVIEIDLPNPDDNSEVEAELYASLRQQNAKSITQTFEADSTNGFKPNAKTRALSMLALIYGKVTTKVQSAKGTVNRSTDKFPKTRILSFEPLNTTDHDVLFNALKDF